MEVNETSFNKAATDILSKYTYKLPGYFTKLSKLKFHTRNKINTKPQIINSISFADRLHKQHQIRIIQLKKGWYQQLKIKHNAP
ncbi:hypothetical protein QUF74_09760 [Candidatus Halobeggiatoa sp. HSG11]|nr:hypothetical protein [Candidatus Halobeggiatoa sp. HSG11]